MDVTVVFKSGGYLLIRNAFNFGTGVAGDVAGVTRYFADKDVEKVIEHKA